MKKFTVQYEDSYGVLETATVESDMMQVTGDYIVFHNTETVNNPNYIPGDIFSAPTYQNYVMVAAYRSPLSVREADGESS